MPPWRGDAKSVDILRDGNDLFISQMTYLHTKGKESDEKTHKTKIELHRELTDDEKTQHYTSAGRLEWVSTGTSLTSACLESTALKGK